MEAWCSRLNEVSGEKHKLFFQRIMEEDKKKASRLKTLCDTVSLPLYSNYVFIMPDEQEHVISLCNSLVNSGWKLSVKLSATDGPVIFRDVDVDVQTVVLAIARLPDRRQCIVRVNPYKEPTISGTVLVTTQGARLEMVYGPHYWLTKAAPSDVTVFSCWYVFPYLSIKYSTADEQQRTSIYRNFRDIVHLTLGSDIRRLSDIGRTVYAEYSWRSDLGYRFFDCSYSKAWTAEAAW